MIRKAVGAIVTQGKNFLIVGKVKLMDVPEGPVDIPIEWHIPAGGIKESDRSNLDAIRRELREETGSESFEIIRELNEKLCFAFPPHIQSISGFEKQETVIFLVKYTGDGNDLTPVDDEIKEVEFVTSKELFNRISGEETLEYLKKFLKLYPI
jgi:putative (di)nucleoside polyphosphate hydrolase